MDEKVVTDFYAVQQGKVLLGIIIGCYCANIFITILAVIAGVFARRAIEKNRDNHAVLMN